LGSGKNAGGKKKNNTKRGNFPKSGGAKNTKSRKIRGFEINVIKIGWV